LFFPGRWPRGSGLRPAASRRRPDDLRRDLPHPSDRNAFRRYVRHTGRVRLPCVLDGPGENIGGCALGWARRRICVCTSRRCERSQLAAITRRTAGRPWGCRPSPRHRAFVAGTAEVATSFCPHWKKDEVPSFISERVLSHAALPTMSRAAAAARVGAVGRRCAGCGRSHGRGGAPPRSWPLLAVESPTRDGRQFLDPVELDWAVTLRRRKAARAFHHRGLSSWRRSSPSCSIPARTTQMQFVAGNGIGQATPPVVSRALGYGRWSPLSAEELTKRGSWSFERMDGLRLRSISAPPRWCGVVDGERGTGWYRDRASRICPHATVAMSTRGTFSPRHLLPYRGIPCPLDVGGGCLHRRPGPHFADGTVIRMGLAPLRDVGDG